MAQCDEFLYLGGNDIATHKSLPSRERGLKYSLSQWTKEEQKVAPFAGAWIEISTSSAFFRSGLVAPFAGAWIEITPSDRAGRSV